MPTPLPSSTPPTLSPSSMFLPSSTPPTLLPTANFDNSQSNHVLRAASSGSGFKVVTDKWVVSSAILSGVIAGIGLIFFALFIWKRETLNPPSYIDLEKANSPDEKGPMIELGEKSPDLPIQPADKNRPEEGNNPFADSVPFPPRQPLPEWKRGHSRNGSNVSSITAYDSYWETLEKRAQLTTSVMSTDSTYRGSILEHGSKDPEYTRTRSRGESVSSVYSDASRYSQTTERISINNVRMPPQFSMPARPPSAASPHHSKRISPPRPPRVRESLALPF